MVSGTLRDGHQYRKPLLPIHRFGLLLLSTCHSCECSYYELGFLDICSRHDFLYDILHCGWKEGLHSTREQGAQVLAAAVRERPLRCS